MRASEARSADRVRRPRSDRRRDLRLALPIEVCEQRPEQVVERAPVGRGERPKEALLVRKMCLDRLVDDGLALAVPAGILAAKPTGLSHVESAAIPLAALSAWQGLFDHGRLEPGERVLILGAAGGVGQFATQLARERGAYVVGSASGEGVDRARELGADEVIDSAHERFEEGVAAVDLVFDTAGGDVLARATAVLREGGRLVSVAEEPPDSAAAGVYFVVEHNREQLAEITRLVDAGRLRPDVDSVFPLAEARAAFERVQARGNVARSCSRSRMNSEKATPLRARAYG